MTKHLSFIPTVFLVCMLLCLSCLAAGTTQDPVVSGSYLSDVYGPELSEQLRKAVDAAGQTVSADIFLDLTQAVAKANQARVCAGTGSPQSGTVRLKQNDVLTLQPGTKLTLISGSADMVGSGLIDITAGLAMSDDSPLPEYHTCMAGSSCRITVTSLTACFGIVGAANLIGSTAMDYNSCADALAALGLFRGTDYGYELERTATRLEGLVMFLRLLGAEQAAQSWSGQQPFSDVPAWGQCYVGYAYAMGYTRGISADEFGCNTAITARDYLTFLLRALGYTEDEDFSWAGAVADSRRLSVITAAEETLLEQGPFLRAHVAWLSWYALFARHQTGSALWQVLEDQSAIRHAQLVRAAALIVGLRR